MTAADVAAVIDALDAVAVPFWVDGGWGVDALVGEQTRAHSDLDLVVPNEDVPRAEAALTGLGFAPDTTAEPGLPTRVVLRDDSRRQVDLHPVLLDDAGDGWQELAGGAWGRYPAAGFGAEGTIGGLRVRCVSADVQLTHHTGYAPDKADRHDIENLAALLGRDVPPPYRRT